MEYSIPFQMYCLPACLVFLCFSCVFMFFSLSAKCPKADAKGAENFQSRMEAIEMCEPDG